MPAYVVTYDLMKQGQNYTCLIEKLKEYPNWAHLQGSVWVVKCDMNAVQIRDDLNSCLDANDKVFVAGLSGEAAWNGHSEEVGNWLQQNL